jgi:hypothetical protein
MGYPPKLKADALKYFETHTAEETAKQFGAPVSTIYTWTKTAGREKIAKRAPQREALAKDVGAALRELSAERKAATADASTESARIAHLEAEVERWKRVAEAYKTLAEEGAL